MPLKPRIHEALVSPLTIPDGYVLTRVRDSWELPFREISITQFIRECATRGKRLLELEKGE